MITLGCALVILCAALLAWQNWQFRRENTALHRELSIERGLATTRNESIAQLVTANMRLRRSYESARLKLAINGIDVTRDSLPVPNDKQSNPNEAA